MCVCVCVLWFANSDLIVEKQQQQQQQQSLQLIKWQNKNNSMATASFCSWCQARGFSVARCTLQPQRVQLLHVCGEVNGNAIASHRQIFHTLHISRPSSAADHIYVRPLSTASTWLKFINYIFHSPTKMKVFFFFLYIYVYTFWPPSHKTEKWSNFGFDFDFLAVRRRLLAFGQFW